MSIHYGKKYPLVNAYSNFYFRLVMGSQTSLSYIGGISVYLQINIPFSCANLLEFYRQVLIHKAMLKQSQLSVVSTVGVSTVGVSTVGVSTVGVSTVGVSTVGVSTVGVSTPEDPLSGISAPKVSVLSA